MHVAQRQLLTSVSGGMYHVTCEVLGGYLSLTETVSVSSGRCSSHGDQYERGDERHGGTCYDHQQRLSQLVPRLTLL